MRTTVSGNKGAKSWVWALLTLLAVAWLGSAQAREAPTAQTLVVMGDSLAAAYGIPADRGWVHLLDQKMKAASLPWRVVNASISGETTAGGAARIEATLASHAPDLVAIELGANDALRGLPLDQAAANLSRMIDASQRAGARVLLIGIRIPPNYGPDYAEALQQMYRDLAAKHGTPLLPFLLEPLGVERDAFQADNLHPTAEAQPRLMAHVWTALEPMLEGASGSAVGAPAQ
jgi:acyl-CoA thioesterase-1